MEYHIPRWIQSVLSKRKYAELAGITYTTFKYRSNLDYIQDLVTQGDK